MNANKEHLDLADRRLIQAMLMEGRPKIEIARLIGCHRSTIYREIDRNTHSNGVKLYYTPSKAQEHANGRKRKPRKTTKLTSEDLKTIWRYLRLYYSPEQISNAVPLPSGATISHESIYKMVYNDKASGGDLHMNLRHRTRKRRKRYRAKDRRGRLEGKRMIDERPKMIDDRETLGHWEMDTVIGKGSNHCLLTLVERKSGFAMIGKLKARTAYEATTTAIKLIKGSAIPVLSITADNGSEFHSYKEIEKATGCTVYFARPHHSWERGTNENTNGLIRQYVPKGMNMKSITQSECDRIASILNTRPRKRHKYLSPHHYICKVA